MQMSEMTEEQSTNDNHNNYDCIHIDFGRDSNRREDDRQIKII